METILSTEEAKSFLKSKRHLLSTPNVVSLGFSNEKVDGRRTGKKIFRVGVINKLPAESIKDPDVFIPKYFKHNVTGSDKVITIPVEVVEEGKINGLMLPLTRLIEMVDRLRRPGGPPYEGGSVIKNADLPVSGCLGANAQYKETYRLLSAAHVLTMFDRDQIGQQILVKDRDAAMVEIGATITDQVDVVLYDTSTVSNPVYAKQDLAWANITGDRGSSTITEIGIPQEIREVVEGEHVKFFAGRTGTKRNVEVDDINAMTKVRVKDISGNIKYAYFEEVCRIDKIVGIGPGDSGTAVVAKDDDALLGILMSVASLSFAAYFCKLQI